MVANSDGKANVAVFTINDYPSLQVFTNGFQKSMAEWCPACKVKIVNQPISDLGTKTPQSVVSTLQRSPDTNW